MKIRRITGASPVCQARRNGRITRRHRRACLRMKTSAGSSTPCAQARMALRERSRDANVMRSALTSWASSSAFRRVIAMMEIGGGPSRAVETGRYRASARAYSN